MNTEAIDRHLAAVHQHNTATLKSWRREVTVRNSTNKAEARELANVQKYIQAGMLDTAARALSALIRATRNKHTREFLIGEAIDADLINRPDFII